jgi:aminoglycoside phosphotransferase (APT) family kinase protein
MTEQPENTPALQAFLDERLGDTEPITVEAMRGGGSCEIFAVSRGGEEWVLRRAPRHASSQTAHDVLREFTILDAIKDEPVLIARPILSCDDSTVFEAPFYVMGRIDGTPIRDRLPEAWGSVPEQHGQALEQLIDAIVAVHTVDWKACGLGDLTHVSADYLKRQISRWISQLHSYGGRDLPSAEQLAEWLESHRPPDQPPALFHGDYKLDNVLYSREVPVQLLAIVDWEMSSIGDPLVDLAWALIFHPGPEGTMRLGTAKEPRFDPAFLPSKAELIERYATASGRDTSAIGWYDVFSRWKLAIALEGSYAKFLRGESSKPIHEYFGQQADLLLASATQIATEAQ